MTDYSVLMSVYGKEKPEYLEQCLRSLSLQTIPVIELVLVRDGPISMALASVIEKYSLALSINVVELDVNVGLAKALNIGLTHCSYDIVIRMDSDDVAVIDRFQIQLSFMAANPDVAVSSGIVVEYDELIENVVSIRELPLSNEEIVVFSKMRNPISHPAVIFRKSAVIAAGGYPLLYPEDYLLWIKMLAKGYRFANIPKVLVKMRTGREFFKRRSWKFLKGEIMIYRYMFNIKHINLLQLISYSVFRTFARLSPTTLKLFLYKNFR